MRDGRPVHGAAVETYWHDKEKDQVFRYTVILGQELPAAIVNGIVEGKYGNLSATDYETKFTVMQRRVKDF
ncbi:hypothetical protein SCHPADRAFT_911249 [Schizopora paradoxa]|uniref:Uncharacterized protein n=1 Tax=Schizopora paradoxa TaxID=27342 RepID=A0A0H2R005_9AGAM|nr:hypothetical protein SCHPADRAFT_911249 [Schizopora paradoxa]